MATPQIIQGVDKSYVNSHVGEIVKAIQETKSCDPVILIDEVEKTGKNQKGSLKDALLHILDNEQNEFFTDAYLGIAIDISKITFILTANDLEKISGPLKSRLEIVKLNGYNETQKLAIGKLLIKKIFQESYSNTNQDIFEMGEEALRTLIKKTPEEGVRQLELNIKNTIRWCFSQWAQQNEKGETETKIVIDANKVNELLAEDLPPEEETENDKLRKKNEALEKENEKLKGEKTAPIINFQLSKLLTISENKEKEHCATHKKLTLSTSEGTCSLCKLAEQTQQIEVVITKENWKTCQEKWQEQKSAWLQQSTKLQNGTKEEQELSQQIKSSIDQIDKKIQQVQKAGNNTNSQSNQWTENLPWLIGGGLILTLFGYYLGWLFTNRPKKKKKNNLNSLQKIPSFLFSFV